MSSSLSTPHRMSPPLAVLLVALACCVPVAACQSTTGSIVLGYYYDVTAGSTHSGSPPQPHSLWCQPPQQYYNLPAAGAAIDAFHTYVDLSQTNVCGSLRFGLYEVTGTQYALVAGTNATSDIAVCPTTATGQSLVSTTAQLYYPSGSSYTVLPGNTYSLCFSNQGDQLTVPGTDDQSGTIYMYYWQDAHTSLSAVNLTYYFDQPLPLVNPVVNQQTNWTFQVWMTVTAPVISWSFAYGVTGQLAASAGTAFSVCTTGSILTAVTPTVANGSSYAILQMYGTRQYSNATVSQTTHIMALAPLKADGNDATLHPSTHPYIDTNGVTYAVNTQPTLPGDSSTPNTGSVLPTNPFVNVFNVTGEVLEDGYVLMSKGYVESMGIKVWLSLNSTAVFDCSVLKAPAPSSSSSSSSSTASRRSSSSSSSSKRSASASPSSSSGSSDSGFGSSSATGSGVSSSSSSSGEVGPIPLPSSSTSSSSSSVCVCYGCVPWPCNNWGTAPSSTSSIGVWWLSSSSSSSLPPTPTAPTVVPSSSSSSSTGLSGGGLAGVIIGVFVGALLVVCIVASCLNYRLVDANSYKAALASPAARPAANQPRIVQAYNGYAPPVGLLPPPYSHNRQLSGENSSAEGHVVPGYAPTIVEMGAARQSPWQQA